MTDIHVPQQAGTGNITYGVHFDGSHPWEIWLYRNGVKTVLICGCDKLEDALLRIAAYRRMRELAKSIGVRIR